MKKSQFTAEEITKILAEAAPRGASKGVARQYRITERTIYQWRQKFGGMKSSEVKSEVDPKDWTVKLDL